MKKSYGPKKLSGVIEEVAKPIYKHNGLVNYKIIAHWNEIVGSRLAQICIPSGIRFSDDNYANGILLVEIENPGFSLEIQANQVIIVERIATYFGYRVVSKIKIQVAAKRRDPSPKQHPTQLESTKKLVNPEVIKALGNIDDQEIRQILENIARYKI